MKTITKPDRNRFAQEYSFKNSSQFEPPIFRYQNQKILTLLNLSPRDFPE
ncbi:hypothetical protein NIES39_O03840 [Arthrospira platensis NIES-39]|nr:hypothetical protein NIES39_O03840 [Arthrospira platensis NIES-39]